VASSVKLNRRALATVVSTAADESAYKGAQAARGRTMSNIIRLGRIDTGKMIQGMQVRRAPELAAKFGPNGSAYTVSSSATYTIYQEKGTRPYASPPGKVMVFKPKGSSTFVFATKRRGVKAGHFLRDAVRASRLADFTR